jgi:hypothetical protein
VVHDNLHLANASQVSLLLYSLVKLRLPEDFLINALTEKSDQLIEEMTPKDLAVTTWSLARLDYPASEQFKQRLNHSIKAVLKKIWEEPYLFESENDPEASALIEQEMRADQGSSEETAPLAEDKGDFAALVTP